MILVTGATGHLGSAAVSHLIKNTDPQNIAVFVRDENKASKLKAAGVDIRIGDYEVPSSLNAGLKGIKQLFLIPGRDARNRLQQHQNVIDAAKNAGVQHILFAGMAMQDVNNSVVRPFLEDYFQTEEYIKNIGLNFTLLHNALYTDGIPIFVGQDVLKTGINLPAGNGRVAHALRREMGEAAANLLLENHPQNKTYQLTGSNLNSFEDIADIITRLSGTSVTYNDADPERFADQIKTIGLPEVIVQVITGFSADIKNGQYEIVTDHLEQLLGRKPASLTEGLKEIYNW